eukprot:10231092-Prorocentrum_lima.AAC.1
MNQQVLQVGLQSGPLGLGGLTGQLGYLDQTQWAGHTNHKRLFFNEHSVNDLYGSSIDLLHSTDVNRGNGGVHHPTRVDELDSSLWSGPTKAAKEFPSYVRLDDILLLKGKFPLVDGGKHRLGPVLSDKGHRDIDTVAQNEGKRPGAVPMGKDEGVFILVPVDNMSLCHHV